MITNQNYNLSNSLFDLKNKCAVVIGGKGLIGASISEALASAGAIVIVASPSSNDDQKLFKDYRKKGLNIFGKKFDQSSENQISLLIKFIKNKFNLCPDILVNSGVKRPMKKFINDSTDNWDESMSFNSRGLFLTCRAFANEMRKNNGGSIINISSIYGLVAPHKDLYLNTNLNTEPDYPYNKGGMIMFSKYLASYYAEYNVRVNCIAPGGIFNNQSKQFIKNYISKVPMKRMGFPKDLNGVAVFLASDSSSYITGATIPVDGGFTII